MSNAVRVGSVGTGSGSGAGCATTSDPHQLDPIGSGAAEGPVTSVFGFIGAGVARGADEPPSGDPTDLIDDAAGAELGRSVDLRWP